jgi:pimeloyl-ACP methyl ester carboxylesterase
MNRLWLGRSRVRLLPLILPLVLTVGAAFVALSAPRLIVALDAPAGQPLIERFGEGRINHAFWSADFQRQRQAADAEKAANEPLARQADLQFELDGAMKPLIRTIEDHREDLESLGLPSDPHNQIAILDALESWLYGTNSPQDPIEFQKYEAIYTGLVRLWSVAAPIQSQMGFAIEHTNEEAIRESSRCEAPDERPVRFCRQRDADHHREPGEFPPAARVPTGSPNESSVPRWTSTVTWHEADRVSTLAFDGPGFYDVPETLSPGNRGSLIRLQALMANDVARVYRVLYHSTSVDGSDVGVSGTIWVPATVPPSRGFPIVAWAPANNGSGDPCAYSAQDQVTRTDYALLMFKLMKEGYVVAYTDYEGHGTRYPYLFAVPESSTYALLDGTRAARDLLGAAASDRVVVAGHSLGAGAATSTLQHGPTYADELDVRGVVAIEGGEDVADSVADAAAGSSPTGIIQGAVGWSAAYAELELADLLTPAALRASTSLEASCGAASSFDSWGFDEAFSANPLEVAGWRERIEASRVRHTPYATFFVVSPTSERHVENIRAVAARLCSASGSVRLQTYGGTDHDTVVKIAEGDYLTWIEDRFNGTRAAGNCDAQHQVALAAYGARPERGRSPVG